MESLLIPLVRVYIPFLGFRISIPAWSRFREMGNTKSPLGSLAMMIHWVTLAFWFSNLCIFIIGGTRHIEVSNIMHKMASQPLNLCWSWNFNSCSSILWSRLLLDSFVCNITSGFYGPGITLYLFYFKVGPQSVIRPCEIHVYGLEIS